MTRWTVAAPTALDSDDVTEPHVRLVGGTVGGTVAVLASGASSGPPATRRQGPPAVRSEPNSKHRGPLRHLPHLP